MSLSRRPSSALVLSFALLSIAAACTPGASDQSGGALPSGTIVAFAGGAVPAGWTVCDGRTSPTGIKTPDLRGQFLRGANVPSLDFTRGGSASHTHELSSGSGRVGVDRDNDAAVAVAAHTHDVTPADHLPPFVEVAFILKD